MINKEIVVDLDDTLSFTLNRDFKNAKPNIPLIKKLQEMHNRGWTINIVTARGQLSCGGDHIKAADKYRGQIIDWLHRHNVPYSSLSFQKKLAKYYIDDKAITPDKFLELEFDVIGKSGAEIIMDSTSVYKEFKTFEEAQSVIIWSYIARNNLSSIKFPDSGRVIIPHINTLIGNELKMERLHHREHTIESIQKSVILAKSFKKMKHVFTQNPMLYFLNIFEHLKSLDKTPFEMQMLNTILNNLFSEQSMTLMFKKLEDTKSFAHGDFSIQNILNVSSSDLGLIDSIFNENKFQSYYLDLAKLKWSLIAERKHTWIKAFNDLTLSSNYDLLGKFVITEGIRTLKYCTPSEKVRRMELIEELC